MNQQTRHIVLLIMWVGHSSRKRSTGNDTINNSDVYDTYKDLYLSEKERKKRLGIQSTNGLKARLGAKKANGTALTLTTQENTIKKRLIKDFQYH